MSGGNGGKDGGKHWKVDTSYFCEHPYVASSLVVATGVSAVAVFLNCCCSGSPNSCVPECIQKTLCENESKCQAAIGGVQVFGAGVVIADRILTEGFFPDGLKLSCCSLIKFSAPFVALVAGSVNLLPTLVCVAKCDPGQKKLATDATEKVDEAGQKVMKCLGGSSPKGCGFVVANMAYVLAGGVTIACLLCKYKN